MLIFGHNERLVSCRVHAQLTQAHGVFVSANLVNLLMHNAAITGPHGPSKASRNPDVPTDERLYDRLQENNKPVLQRSLESKFAKEKYTAAPF